MITLIHGDDIQKSRDFYWELKQKTLNSLTFDGIKISITDLQQAISGEDLFGTAKPVFIEELFSKRKSPKEIEQLAEMISASNAPVTLWESKELTPKQTGLLKGVTNKLFKIPSTVFALLDNLRPDNGNVLVKEFHKTLEEKDAEFVLFMLTRHIRMLLELQNTDGQSISEVSRLAPWQRGKLEKQTKLFVQEKLLEIHSKLFELELGMKTGGLSMSLEDSIDLFLLSI